MHLVRIRKFSAFALLLGNFDVAPYLYVTERSLRVYRGVVVQTIEVTSYKVFGDHLMQAMLF